MFDQIIRRYKIGKSAEEKYFEIRHFTRGRIIYTTFATLLADMAEHDANDYVVDLQGDANVRGITLLEEYNADNLKQP